MLATPKSEAFPLALNHAMWAKYKIGESEKIDDPETKMAAVKNPYFEPKPGALRNDNFAIDKLLARGTVFGACNLWIAVLRAVGLANEGLGASSPAWTRSAPRA